MLQKLQIFAIFASKLASTVPLKYIQHWVIWEYIHAYFNIYYLNYSLKKNKINRKCIRNLWFIVFQYDSELCIEALVGFTLDKKEVILTNINETVTSGLSLG